MYLRTDAWKGGMSRASHTSPGGGKSMVGRQVSSVWKRDSSRGRKYHLETLERCQGSEQGHRILDHEDTGERRQPSMLQKHFETFISHKKREAALYLSVNKASHLKYIYKINFVLGDI